VSPPLVLVVDDAPDLRDLWCMLLEDEGFATHAASDGTEALAALDAGLRPQLILLDYSMPDVDGLDVVAALARDAALAAIPVILATGVNFTTTPPGVVQVLFKPFPPQLLVDAIRAHATPAATRAHG
jgi:CheY-like chemotaxis protein